MDHTILIIDDQPAILTLLRGILAKRPYQVVSARSALEALDILSQKDVDVVISDERMPGMTGSDFLSIIREQYPDTVRIMLTGYASLDSAIKAINEGEIFRFLTKPCRNQELIEAVDAAVSHRTKIGRSEKSGTAESMLGEQTPGIIRVERDDDDVIITEDD